MIAMSAVAQLSSTDCLTWRIVIERGGTHRLYLMRMYAHLPSSAVMERIMDTYLREQPWWSRQLFRPIMEIATTADPIDTSNGQEVVVLRSSPSNLNEANRNMLVAGFARSPGANGSHKAILLRPKLSSIGLGVVSLGILLAIAAPGVLVGVIVGQAELGITLSAAIAGTLALAGNLHG